jgi:nucleotide-binding universal stress UspA family protein
MTAPQNVLAAVDFSEPSARAVAVAGFVAQVCQARLTLMHAESIEAPAYFTTDQLDHFERARRAGRDAVEASVARFGREHTQAAFAVVLHDAPPADAVVHASASADLVVMGTHGRQGPARWWLGSVAERAVHTVLKPLMIVRSEVAPLDTLFARILVYGDSRSSGGQALDYARSLAARCGGTVFDERGLAIEAALDRTRATIVIVATPHARTAPWMSRYVERIVQCCTVPLLFVPELTEGEAL